jgi:tRNA-specific 2-thiouridylase
MNCTDLAPLSFVPERAEDSSKPLVAVGMSGGVDSSTVAALLAKDYRVVGLTMQLWDQRRLAEVDPTAPRKVEGRCCSGGDVYDARRVAEHLHFPFYVINLQRQFEETVVRPFVEEYVAGRTPIPCALCNNHVKFDQMLGTARQVGAELLATGHYARVERDEASGRYLLRRAVDHTKDQTYFLFGLKQEQLSRTIFPLGGMTKREVRELANRLQLPVANKPESQEICFVPSGDTARFVESYREEQGTPVDGVAGEIVSGEGKTLARHGGVHHFTVGQRKGLGIATGSPLYVLSIDSATQKIVVGAESDLYSKTASVRDVNWIAFESPPTTLRCAVKIRHRHFPAPATLHLEGDSAHGEPSALLVEFDEPQRAITPGQAAVFYQDDLVLGGGWIASPQANSSPSSK